MRQLTLVLISAIIFIGPVNSQDFGGFSPGINWQQINTKPVRVIYPSGMKDQADRVANLVNYMWENNKTTIGDRTKKLELVLNNQGIIPNGYVTLMPYRSEFFTTPMQSTELGSLPWLDLLAVHEYRHALQFSNFRTGVTKVGYLLMGEVFWAVALNLTTPDWFLEGDAVVTETALTSQGRGRIPNYIQGYQSLLSERKPYSYQKVRNGSYKHDIPDHYRLGYLLCSYGREFYGDSLWMNVVNRTARFKGIIYPFSKAMRKYTGLKSRQFYKEAMLYYQAKWDSSNQFRIPDESFRLTPKYKTITHFDYPQWDPSTESWLAIRSSFKNTAAVYSIHQDGSQNKIVELGIHIDPVFSVGKSMIVWAEISWDKRFSTKNYSDLVVYDRQTGNKTYLTKAQRYFSPAISPDQSKIAVIETNQFNEHQIVILDAANGDVLFSIPNRDNHYLSYPQWNQTGDQIFTTIRDHEGKMAVMKSHVQTMDSELLFTPINHILGKICVADNYILFDATFEGEQDVFIFDFNNQKMNRLTNSPFGASKPAVDNEGTICYVEFSHEGSSLHLKDVNRIISPVTDFTGLDQLDQLDKPYALSEGGDILSLELDNSYEERPYRTGLHALKIHSWGPEFSTSAVGLSVISDNVLNNIHFEGGYQYYLNEQSSGYQVSAVYGKYLPLLSLDYQQGYRTSGSDPDFEIVDRVWERKVGAGIQLPLNFSKGLFYRNSSSRLQLFNTTVPANQTQDNFSSGKISFSSLAFSTSYYSTKLSAKQNITTPFGYGAEVSYQKSITGEIGEQLQIFVDGAIRGLFPNHNFVTGVSYKRENSSNSYQYIDLNAYPRGYTIPKNDWILTSQFNYHFPIFYPDFGFGGLIYFSRIRGNLFFDLGIGDTYNASSNQIKRTRFQSTGMEMIADMKMFHLLPFSVGVRLYSLGISDQNKLKEDYGVEFFIPIIRL